MNEIKLCNTCKKDKSISEFRYKKSRNKYIHNSQCKECEKNYRDGRKELQKEKALEYYRKNKTSIDRRNNKYIKKNKDKVLAQQRDYYKNNKDKILERQKKYQSDNREKINEYLKSYNKSPKMKKYQREYSKRKRANDINYSLRLKLSVRLSESINRANAGKSSSLMAVLGCSIDELKKWLQVEDVYDGKKYHIDHVIPCKLYDFSKSEEIKKCFNYRNLRIIPAKENLSKKDKLDLDLIKSLKITHLLPA